MAAFGKGLIVFLLFGALLVACGGDSEDTSGADDGGSAPSASSDDGSSSGSADPAEIAAASKALKTYFEAILKADPNGYDLITAESKQKCSKAKFTSDIQGVKATFAAFGQNVVVQKVINMSVDGKNANGDVEITIDGKPSPSGPLNAGLEKEGGKWLVVDFCA